MTRVYFVRHAQPEHGWADDRTRPLTKEGWGDTLAVAEALSNEPIDAFYSSPYRRSMDTIRQAALDHGFRVARKKELLMTLKTFLGSKRADVPD